MTEFRPTATCAKALDLDKTSLPRHSILVMEQVRWGCYRLARRRRPDRRMPVAFSTTLLPMCSGSAITLEAFPLSSGSKSDWDVQSYRLGTTASTTNIGPSRRIHFGINYPNFAKLAPDTRKDPWTTAMARCIKSYDPSAVSRADRRGFKSRP